MIYHKTPLRILRLVYLYFIPEMLKRERSDVFGLLNKWPTWSPEKEPGLFDQ